MRSRSASAASVASIVLSSPAVAAAAAAAATAAATRETPQKHSSSVSAVSSAHKSLARFLATALREEFEFIVSLSAQQLRVVYDTFMQKSKNGPMRPSWSWHWELTMNITRSFLRIPDLNHRRLRAFKVFIDNIPAPPGVKLDHVRLQIHRPTLIQREQEAEAHHQQIGDISTWPGHGFMPVPKECGKSSDTYNIDCEWLESVYSPPTSNKVVLYLHGGAYTLLSKEAHRTVTSRVAAATGCRLFVINYRLAPEDPFPAATHDAYAAFLYLVQPDHPAISHVKRAFETKGRPFTHKAIDPSNIIFMGDSAGGGLTMSLLLYLRDYINFDKKAPLFAPVAGAALLSPWMDLSCSSPTWLSNAHLDWLPSHPDPETLDPLGDLLDYQSVLRAPADYLIGNPKVHLNDRNRTKRAQRENMVMLVRHYLASPAFANMQDLGNILIQSGDCEVLHDEGRLGAHKMSIENRISNACAPSSTSPPSRPAKSFVRHEAYADMTHVFMAFFYLPLAKEAFRRLGLFVQSLETKPENEDVANYMPTETQLADGVKWEIISTTGEAQLFEKPAGMEGTRDWYEAAMDAGEGDYYQEQDIQVQDAVTGEIKETDTIRIST